MNNGTTAITDAPMAVIDPLAIQPGKVAYIKTTDEPVFVLNISQDGSVAVRRPVQGDKGVEHRIELFGYNELQSAEAKVTAEADFTKFTIELREKLMADRAKKQDALPVQKVMFDS